MFNVAEEMELIKKQAEAQGRAEGKAIADLQNAIITIELLKSTQPDKSYKEVIEMVVKGLKCNATIQKELAVKFL